MKQSTYTILVLEDEVLLLRAITLKLNKLGMSVVSCTTGQQALNYLHDLPTPPDAIWLDYYLTDMNGLEFLQQVKSNPAWDSIPVVVVSNSASSDKVKNMLALGVHKYLLKAEYRLDEIAQIIEETIRNG